MMTLGRCALYVLGLVLLCPSAGHAAEAKKKADQPVTVQQTVEATLRNHHTLKAIQENRDVVQNELRRAKAGWGPRVDMNGRGGAGQLSSTTTRPLGVDKGFYGASGIGVTLVQPLWDGFATRSRVRSAQATLDSMSSRVFDNATSLGLDGLISHIDVLRRRVIYDLALKNVQRHEEILISAKDRQVMGADTLADVTQTEGRLARARSTLSEAKASLREGEEAYRRITNTPVPAEMTTVDMPAPMYEGTEPILEQAKQTNPKLAAYVDDVRAARGDQELAKSAYHPTINLEVGPNYSDRSGRGDQWTSSMDVMGTVRWNLFNSGADVAESDAATARVRQARQVMYSFLDDLDQQIEDSWTAYISAQEQFQHYTDAIQYNTATRDAYLEQFMTGQRSLLDVLDAENELFNSSTQAATAQGNILVAAWRMYALDGTFLPQLHVETKGLYDAPKDPSKPEEMTTLGAGAKRP